MVVYICLRRLFIDVECGLWINNNQYHFILGVLNFVKLHKFLRFFFIYEIRQLFGEAGKCGIRQLSESRQFFSSRLKDKVPSKPNGRKCLSKNISRIYCKLYALNSPANIPLSSIATIPYEMPEIKISVQLIR